MLSCSRGLILKEKGASTRRHTKETIELETEVSAQRLRAFHVSEPTKKGVIALAGATNPRYQGKIRPLCCSKDKEELV